MFCVFQRNRSIVNKLVTYLVATTLFNLFYSFLIHLDVMCNKHTHTHTRYKLTLTDILWHTHTHTYTVKMMEKILTTITTIHRHYHYYRHYYSIHNRSLIYSIFIANSPFEKNTAWILEKSHPIQFNSIQLNDNNWWFKQWQSTTNQSKCLLNWVMKLNY